MWQILIKKNAIKLVYSFHKKRSTMQVARLLSIVLGPISDWPLPKSAINATQWWWTMTRRAVRDSSCSQCSVSVIIAFMSIYCLFVFCCRHTVHLVFLPVIQCRFHSAFHAGDEPSLLPELIFGNGERE
jgi:hypothetical protein